MLRSELKDYFDRARRFDQDRLLGAERSKKIAYAVAIVATTLAALSTGAVIMLTPLKTVEPYVIRVDNGTVDVISALKERAIASSDLDEVTKFNAARYVQARESWFPAEAASNFDEVTLMSTPPVQQRFADFYNSDTADAPRTRFRNATAEVSIRSISLTGNNVVTVRYVRTVRQGEGEVKTYWIASMTYEYSDEPIATSDRLVNPLGFLVSEYHADTETFK